MEAIFEIKNCEACGRLYLRAENTSGVYCKACAEILRKFPTPESRKRRGRPPKKLLLEVIQ